MRPHRVVAYLALLAVLGMALLPGGAPGARAQDTLRQAEYQGWDLTYPTSLAHNVSGSTIPIETENPWRMNDPAHVRFDFEGYQVLNGSRLTPQIAIYPLGASWERVSNRLSALLQQHPDLRDRYPAYYLRPVYNPLAIPPFAPGENAAMVLVLKPQYLSFKGGSGIRYLTYLTQGVTSFTEDMEYLIYTYQGLTDDKKYYVTAQFPIAVDLPGGQPFHGDPRDSKWGEAVLAFDRAMAGQLDQLPDSAYRPDLAALDAVIASLSPGPRARSPMSTKRTSTSSIWRHGQPTNLHATAKTATQRGRPMGSGWPLRVTATSTSCGWMAQRRGSWCA